MILLIWQGWGLLAPVILASCVGASGLLFGLLPRSIVGYDPIPFLVLGFIASAYLTWRIGKKINSRPGRELIDPKTNERIELKQHHSLFWIPLQWWSTLSIAGAIFGIIGEIFR
ncbi:hypothetical protein KNO81_41440 [Paraburkholderia sediminicola]|nr:hypothetical protein [Paraburkholderia sediminicola]